MGLCIFFLGRYDESNIILNETVQQVPTYPAALAVLAAGQAFAGSPAAAVTAARWRDCGSSYGALANMRKDQHYQRMIDGVAQAEAMAEATIVAKH